MINQIVINDITGEQSIMPKIEDFTFYGSTGQAYNFEVYPIGTYFFPVAGVYMFTKRSTNQKGFVVHTIRYIGETQSFRDRPLNSGHPKWGTALKMGFDHICVLATNSRMFIQNNLINRYNPPLNKR